jgi:hypothetical protein
LKFLKCLTTLLKEIDIQSKTSSAMDTQQFHSFAKESKTLNEFVQKLGYKCYGSTLKNLIKEHNVDVSHLSISHKYIDQMLKIAGFATYNFHENNLMFSF